ncbi:hypothetical protein SAMD00019534_028660 [Acytostelium subglobosum LB1]|uniref:hypothetical protein n=1 Tax=Acytostelium subglobosum LB1 TaxID=1410327 RepID=UPI0006450157|nr:hypothetical protein SAMD00019534_028660 [Acytostelium subglobosum LB1]GAM19691.1 hypothetical protein SAMD00019534_028660 [Acytostelium subglobosum LB1]|eukprot:XP_012756453.1 hypothetical protein SAMD00019534_028660 [Acytostelium subglobosum LB1]
MVKQCDSCGSSEVDYSPDGIAVCTQCAKVLTVVNLVTQEDYGSGGGGGGASSNRSSLPSKYQKKRYLTSSSGSKRAVTQDITAHQMESISKTCDLLQLSSALKVEMVGFYNNVLRKMPSIKMHRADLVAGALAYIVIKHNKRPLNLMDISGVIGQEFYALGRLATKMTKVVGVSLDQSDLPTFIDRILTQYKTEFNTEEMKQLRMLMAELINFADKGQLVEGRSPSAIVCACAYLALHAKTLVKPDIDRICKILSTTTKSAQQRVREFKSMIVCYCAKSPLLSKMNVTEQNYHKYTRIIVKDYFMNEKPNNQIQDEDDKLYLMGDEEEKEEEGGDAIEDDDTDDMEDNYYEGEDYDEEKELLLEREEQATVDSTSSPLLTYSDDDRGHKRIKLPQQEPSKKPRPNSYKYRQYLKHHQRTSPNGQACPPAFIKASFDRIRRKIKLIQAKQRLLSISAPGCEHIKVTEEDLNFCIINEPYKDDRITLNEELNLEKLLMYKISEETIIDGNVDLETVEVEKLCKLHPDLMDKELNESDIPTSNLQRFIRTQDEIESLKQIVTYDGDNS